MGRKMDNKIEEVKKVLRDALWMAYCSGRANNKYIPEEVLPDLMKRCQLFEPKVIPKCFKCGQLMFWYEPWGMYICESWKNMEGGCKTWLSCDEPKPDDIPLLIDKRIIAMVANVKDAECQQKMEEIFKEIESRAVTDREGIICVPIGKRKIVTNKIVEELAQWWQSLKDK